MAIRPLAVSSMDRSTWAEDPIEEAERNGLGRRLKLDDAPGNAAMLRGYYPLKAKLLNRDQVLGFQVGTILKYARVKKVPARFPIEVFFSGRDAKGDTVIRRINYDSNEVELFQD